MDIFTTVLTKIRPTPIKPEKLRVKSLKKEAATRPLTDDANHLEDHELYFVPEHKEEHTEHQQQEQAKQKSENVTAKEPDILHKQDITQPKKPKSDDEGEHLDIYV